MIVFLVSLPCVLHAGRGDKAGTSAAPELLIPVGARSVALGGASLSSITGVEAIYWNPAGLSRSMPSFDVMVSHMSYLADIGVNYFAASRNLADLGTVGLAVKSLSVGEIGITTEDQPDGTGETTSPTFLVVGGAFSRRMSDKISVGAVVNVAFEQMAAVSARGVSFTCGVQYTDLGGMDGLSFGAVVKNIGPGMKYDGPGLLRTGIVIDALRPGSEIKIEAASADLPSTIEIGLGYTALLTASGRINVMSSFQNNNFSEDEYRLGGEYAFQDMFFLRGGFSYASEEEGREYIYGPTMGLGIHTMVENLAVSVDYAYRSVKYFSGNHVIGLNIGF